MTDTARYSNIYVENNINFPGLANSVEADTLYYNNGVISYGLATAGPKGDKGDQGIQGIQGDKGDQGIQGIQGDKGDQGTAGTNGSKGDKGDKGDPGLNSTINFLVADNVSGNNVYEIADTDKTNNVTINHASGTVNTTAVTSSTITTPTTIITSPSLQLSNLNNGSSANMLFYNSGTKAVTYGSTALGTGYIAVNTTSVSLGSNTNGNLQIITVPAATVGAAGQTLRFYNVVVITGGPALLADDASYGFGYQNSTFSGYNLNNLSADSPCILIYRGELTCTTFNAGNVTSQFRYSESLSYASTTSTYNRTYTGTNNTVMNCSIANNFCGAMFNMASSSMSTVSYITKCWLE